MIPATGIKAITAIQAIRDAGSRCGRVITRTASAITITVLTIRARRAVPTIHLIIGSVKDGSMSSLIANGEFEAKIVGADPDSDLALLKIKSKDQLPAIKMGRRKRYRKGALERNGSP